MPITPIRLGDVVKLKKPHPCGSNEWEVTRLGADVKLKCRGCDRQVMLERFEFDRRFRGFIERPAEPAEPGGSPAASRTTEEAPAEGEERD